MSAWNSRNGRARLQERHPARGRRPARRRERASEHEQWQAPCGTGWRTNKPKGGVAGSRSACIVLMTAGNRGRWDPSEGRRASHVQDHGGGTGRKPEFRQPVHGTAMDSRSERKRESVIRGTECVSHARSGLREMWSSTFPAETRIGSACSWASRNRSSMCRSRKPLTDSWHTSERNIATSRQPPSESLPRWRVGGPSWGSVRSRAGSGRTFEVVLLLWTTDRHS